MPLILLYIHMCVCVCVWGGCMCNTVTGRQWFKHFYSWRAAGGCRWSL